MLWHKAVHRAWKKLPCAPHNGGVLSQNLCCCSYLKSVTNHSLLFAGYSGSNYDLCIHSNILHTLLTCKYSECILCWLDASLRPLFWLQYTSASPCTSLVSTACLWLLSLVSACIKLPGTLNGCFVSGKSTGGQKWPKMTPFKKLEDRVGENEYFYNLGPSLLQPKSWVKGCICRITYCCCLFQIHLYSFNIKESSEVVA